MQRALLFIASVAAALTVDFRAVAQEAQTDQAGPDKVTAHLYGQVRGDMSYLSRRNTTTREGTLVYFPLDYDPDMSGYDLNAVSSFGFYSINSRLGVDISGGKAFGADLSGKIEGDFGGFTATFGANATIMRIRQAYVCMSWRHADLILGQTFHPLAESFRADVLTLAAGTPFTSTNRAPQIRFDRRAGAFTFSAAAAWQLQTVSRGPSGNVDTYQQEAAVPELYLGAKYSRNGLTAGVEAGRLELRPRTQSTVGDDVYRVNERLASFSYGGYVRYEKGLFSVGAKSFMGQNLAHINLIGGYGVSSIDPVTGQQEYTNFNIWSSMLSATYGKLYRVGLFLALARNMGTQKPLVADSPLYGRGLNMNSFAHISTNFSYNLPWFTLGAEYELALAAFGDPGSLNLATGRYASTHTVVNHRLAAVVIYSF